MSRMNPDSERAAAPLRWTGTPTRSITARRHTPIFVAYQSGFASHRAGLADQPPVPRRAFLTSMNNEREITPLVYIRTQPHVGRGDCRSLRHCRDRRCAELHAVAGGGPAAAVLAGVPAGDPAVDC